MSKPHLVTLISNDTCVSCLFLSLTLSTARLNPSQSTSSHGKINQSSWPNQIDKSKKKYEAINNYAYKRSKKTQITFMEKIDLVINS